MLPPGLTRSERQLKSYNPTPPSPLSLFARSPEASEQRERGLSCSVAAFNCVPAGASPTENQTLADAEFEAQMLRTHARDDILKPIRG